MPFQSDIIAHYRSSTAPSISMQKVSKTFDRQVVQDLDLEVSPGTIIGLVGPSGCGKSTTVRLLTGVYKPTSGTMRVLGEEPGHFSARTRTQIGYMPQQYVLSQHMTVWDSVQFVSSLYGMNWFRRGARLREVLKLVDLHEHTHKYVGTLSGGMQRRLALACTIAHDPAVIFADEPTAGLDPDLRHRFWEHFHYLRDKQKCTLFVTTQYIGEVEHCDQVAVMRRGQLLFIDTPTGMRRRALGGDALVLHVEPADTERTRELLSAHPYVRDIRRSTQHDGVLFITVTDAGAALAQLGSFLQERAIAIQQLIEFKPSFDTLLMLILEQYNEILDSQEANHG